MTESNYVEILLGLVQVGLGGLVIFILQSIDGRVSRLETHLMGWDGSTDRRQDKKEV